MAKLLLETVSFEIGSIKADGYTTNQLDANSNYINYMSGSGMALMIDLDDSAPLQKRLSKELKAMLGIGFKPLQGECKNMNISCWTTLQAATFFQYHAYKGNKKAQALGIALIGTTLDTIINDEFNRAYIQHQAKKIAGLRFKTVETFIEATDEINNYIISNNLRGSKKALFMYSNYSDAINRGLFGLAARQIKIELGVEKDTKLIRNNYGEKSLRRIDLVQSLSAALINNGIEPVQAVKQAIATYKFQHISYND